MTPPPPPSRPSPSPTPRERWLESLVEHSLGIIATHDLDGRLLSVNRGGAELLGLDAEASVGRPIRDLLSPEVRGDEEDYLDRIRRRGTDRGLVNLLDAEGRRRVFLFHNTLVTDGSEPYVVAHAQDVTEAVRTERALRRREAILEAVAFAAERFLGGRWKEEVDGVLARLGEAARVSRVYLFRIHRGEDERLLASQLNEWVAPGVDPEIDNPELQDFPFGGTFERWATLMAAGRPVTGAVEDFPAPEQAVLQPQGIVSIADVPVFVGGEWWGFLGFDDCERKRRWSPAEIETLGAAANLLGEAILRTRSEEALRVSEERFRVLVDNVPGVVYLCRNDERYSMLYLSEDVEGLTGYSAEEFLRDEVSFVELYHPEDGEEVRSKVDAALEDRRPFLLVYRIRHADGGWRWIEERGQGVFAAAGGLRFLEGSLVDITDRKRTEDQLVFNALHDPLTRLPNRVLLSDRLEVALGRGRRRGNARFALLFLDLDRFKVVNDSLGHTAGDRLLVAIADRLRQVVRPGDTVARLGGDEFAILLEDLDRDADALRAAERILASLAEPFDVDGREMFTGGSIGIAFHRTEYEEPAEMLRDADTAMYRAKALGRGRHVVFDPEMHERALARLRIESDLRRAVDRHEFLLHYQPIVDLEESRVVGFEALLRWQHPEGGILGPGAFLEAAVETGLLLPVGQWVLREACREASRWRAEAPGVAVFVNLHAVEFGHSDLVPVVEASLEESGLAGEGLKLELTEHVVMEDPDRTAEVLGALRGLGVELCVDDFGIGYSSLSQLHRFPISTLKLDRSFVAGLQETPEGREIVRTVQALGSSMGLVTIAEGVEREDQLTVLRELGYRHAQGHLFSRPVPGSELRRLLREGVASPRDDE